jgi:hypothetical protein
LSPEKKTSPWVWVAAGCGCLLLLVGAAVVAIGGFTFKTIKDIEEGVKNPEKRRENTQRILGYEELPDGYHPLIGLKLPLVLELGVLIDQPPNPEGEVDELVRRAFFYTRLANWVTRDNDLRDAFEGEGDPAALLDKIETDIQVRVAERIGEGELTIGDQPVRYATQRGDMFLEGQDITGVFALVVVKCGKGQRPGLGGWMAPDPFPDEDIETADFSGTPADPDTLAEFLSAFRLCQ